MKTLIIAVVLGAVGYYVFLYEPTETERVPEQKTQNQIDREELGVEGTSYEGAITETYNKYKKGVSDAKSAVQKIEDRVGGY